MHSTKKVLSDEDTLDVKRAAEAVQENYRLNAKTGGKPKSRLNSIKAHIKWLKRKQAQESFRQKLKEVWNKNKKS